MRFVVTYETTTPESIEHGDNADHGYVMPGEWRYSLLDETLDHANQDYSMSLREALDLASPDQDCGRWFSETSEGRCNYRTGEVEQRAIHPARDITPASYDRLKRLLGAR